METPRCSECSIRLKPTFKPTRHKEDWCWLECDECLEAVCKDCSVEDDAGGVLCTTCYGAHAVKSEKAYGVFQAAGKGMRHLGTVWAITSVSALEMGVQQFGEDISVYLI